MMIQTINPATGAVIQTYKTLTAEETDTVVHSGHQAFMSWRDTSLSRRSTLMMKLADRLEARVDEYSLLIAREMGKPIQLGRAEIEKCALVCRHYANQAEFYLQPHIIQTEMTKTMVCYQPLGLVFSIMPWNYPFWQVFRFLAPTLMAGNTVLLKHAPLCLGTGTAIAKLLRDVGFPDNVFQHAVLDNDMAARVIAHTNVVGLSFTGSEPTGRIVASLAAANLKKSVLELGGNDPCIVLADADCDLAARNIVRSRLLNCGQVCVSPKRIIALPSIYEKLIDSIKQLVADYVTGDPENEATMLGPMAREDLRKNLHRQVQESVSRKATLLTGGFIPEGPGFYYPPTILTDVKPGMPAFDEELFGPVFAVIRADDEAHAIELANNSQFGLASSVYTQNALRGEEIALELNTGSCFVNAVVTSDPRVPFGGIKHSGYGRELSREGILEFVNIKTIAIK